MKKSKINILIIAMTFALIGLVTIQILWSIKTIETEEIRFDATINKILSNVVINIEKDRTANIIIEKVSGESGKVVWAENSTTDSVKLQMEMEFHKFT
ncbi:MAG: hypothetical protein PF445_08840 [Melioribacteraceae bacterium]|jgi:hypothetical protein|nr:hypothetical protein [Melioribacteraceae bacterium]